MSSIVIFRPILIENNISLERLKPYQTVFQTKSDQELVGVYLWNLNACSEIYHLIATVEITLRNAIDQALVANLERFWWSKKNLRYKSFNPLLNNSIKPDSIKKLSNNFSSATLAVKHEKFSRYQSKAKPTHDEIIAKTEFSTWEYVLDKEFLGPGLIWPQYMPTVFRGTWPTTKAKTTLTAIKDLVKTVRLFRNRIFHHEPAWKKAGVSNEVQAIQHLHDKIDTITRLIEIISPEKLNLLYESKIIHNARYACSSDEIKRFQDGSNFGIK